MSQLTSDGRRRSCATCFFAEVEGIDPSTLKPAYLCLHGPASCTIFPVQKQGAVTQVLMNASGFPRMNENQWCYQWKEREQDS